MGGFALFRMHSITRAQLIEKHEFYVQQAQKRLLEQFTDETISKECDQIEDEAWEESGRYFNPDIDDGSEGVENAIQAGVWRYELLTNLRDGVRLNIIVGFFHEWEKSVRQWLVDEIKHWHRGEITEQRIWRMKFDELFELLESFNWPIRSADCFCHLNACRLVVNVHKHGNGFSLKELSNDFPSDLPLNCHPA